MSAELPPPYTALTRHPMLARTAMMRPARFNFLTHLNRYLSGTLGPGNRLAYETRVLPAFRAEHGRDPQHRDEIRAGMNRDPFHAMWSALKRNSMEMRQHNGRQIVLRQLDELDAQARQFNEHSGQLELDPAVRPAVVPDRSRYPLPARRLSRRGAARATFRPAPTTTSASSPPPAARLAALNDGGGQAVVAWLKQERPDWQPRRVLDVGCTVGHSALPHRPGLSRRGGDRDRHRRPGAALWRGAGGGAGGAQHPLRPGQRRRPLALARRRISTGCRPRCSCTSCRARRCPGCSPNATACSRRAG